LSLIVAVNFPSSSQIATDSEHGRKISEKKADSADETF